MDFDENPQRFLVLKRGPGTKSRGAGRHQERPRRHQGVSWGLLCGHCVVTLWIVGSLFDHLEYMRLTLESVWSVFEKPSFFQRILMSLYNSGVNLAPLWGHFGVTLGTRGWL